MSYKIIRSQSSNRLSEVPHVKSSDVALLRMTKGVAKYKIFGDCTFFSGQSAKLNDHEVCVIESTSDYVTLCSSGVHLPVKGRLVQDYVAVDPHEISQAFVNFWNPFWMRDSKESQDGPEEWVDFMQELDSCEFPHWEIPVVTDDVEVWKSAIRSLKKDKAEGICGWRYEEFQQLPHQAVEHLAMIFSKLWPYGLTRNMMHARVSLLEQCPNPKSMADARPITILSCLYRLASKVVFLQVVRRWKDLLPSGVSGGVPGKSVRDLSLAQTFAVEEAISVKSFRCGTTMDLAKAFNLVPRFPAAVLLNRLGLSWHLLSFWIESLKNMTRSPIISGCLGIRIGSTTGVPEGDVWSVLAMIAISTLFYYKNVTVTVTPFSYADNWSWISHTVRDNFKAWIKTLNLVGSLRMVISIAKSWLWATSTKLWPELELTNMLFPSGSDRVPILEHAKDLGEIQGSLSFLSKHRLC